MLGHCSKSDLDPAYKIAKKLWNLGYSAEDIITNIFRVCKTHNELAEYIKLEFIKVKNNNFRNMNKMGISDEHFVWLRTRTVGQKIKKVQTKKLLKSSKSISRKNFFLNIFHEN